MKIAAKFLILFFYLGTCFASNESNSNRAEEFYRSGDWQKAKESYKAIIDSQPNKESIDPALLYNYGTVLFRNGAAPESYAYLLKAYFLSPFDREIRHNLQLVSAKIPEPAKTIQPVIWYSWWPEALRPLPPELWLFIMLIFITLSLSSSLGHVERGLRLPAAVGAALFLGLGICSWNQKTMPVGAVIQATQIRSGPDSKFPEITSLVAGALINLDETRGEWIKIRFSVSGNETVGWIPLPTVLLID